MLGSVGRFMFWCFVVFCTVNSSCNALFNQLNGYYGSAKGGKESRAVKSIPLAVLKQAYKDKLPARFMNFRRSYEVPTDFIDWKKELPIGFMDDKDENKIPVQLLKDENKLPAGFMYTKKDVEEIPPTFMDFKLKKREDDLWKRALGLYLKTVADKKK